MSESMFYLRALFASVDEAGRAMDELETYLANAANAHVEGEHVGAVREADRGAEWSLEVEERADGPSVEYRNLVWAHGRWEKLAAWMLRQPGCRGVAWMNGGDLDENALFQFLHVAPGTVARITPEA